MSASALLRRFPELEGRIPHLLLGEWPTPVQRLALGARLGADLWVKRDDLSAPVYGGNKVRKLEHLLADAMRERAGSLITMGGIGSNHVVATALYGRQLGLPTVAVVAPQPVTPFVRRVLELVRALDVELVPCRSRLTIPLALPGARRRADRPYLIGPGGSSPLGTMGYVAAGLELGQQVADGILPAPDEVFVALGSGGTLAGLALGLHLAGLRCRLVGVRVVERPLISKTWVQILVARTAQVLRANVPCLRPGHVEISLCHRYLGSGYGHTTEAGSEAIQSLFDSDGLTLEPTYTGKVAAALLEQARNARARRLLFWHTYNSRDTGPLLEAGGAMRPLPEIVTAWLNAAA